MRCLLVAVVVVVLSSSGYHRCYTTCYKTLTIPTNGQLKVLLVHSNYTFNLILTEVMSPIHWTSFNTLRLNVSNTVDEFQYIMTKCLQYSGRVPMCRLLRYTHIYYTRVCVSCKSTGCRFFIGF